MIQTIARLCGLAIICFVSIVHAQITPKIVGGSPSSINEWPWMSGLVEKQQTAIDGLFCGASLIAKDWVLTAAHCVLDRTPDDIEVIINQPLLDQLDGERISVDDIIIHPDFDDFTLDNDVALIKLTTSSENSPVRLISPYSTLDNGEHTGLVLGWGSLSAFRDVFPVNLQQAFLPIVSRDDCIIYLDDITDNMLCAGYRLGWKDTCWGDSGGPLLVLDRTDNVWKQVGITSWGIGCAQLNSYGVYSRLKNYASFITEQVCSSDEIPRAPQVNLQIIDHRVIAHWETVEQVTGYRLNYAPYPQAEPVTSIEMGQNTEFSATLNTGDAFYVAISDYNHNCLSGFSNIEFFTIQ